MDKYICKNAIEDGAKLISCKFCKDKYCKYQKYCPTDHKWYNSKLYKECEYLDKE